MRMRTAERIILPLVLLVVIIAIGLVLCSNPAISEGITIIRHSVQKSQGYSDIPLTHHAQNAHCDERWNAITIQEAFDSGKCRPNINQCETRSFHYCEIENGTEIGLVVGKTKEFITVIVTGFAAPSGYWNNCGDAQ